MTDWLEKARAGCIECKPDDSAAWPCPRESEHQRAAAKMAEAWDEALDAVLEEPQHHAGTSARWIEKSRIEALRQRGPGDES